MKIYVISEPYYRSTVWFKQTIDALIKKATATRHEVVETDADELVMTKGSHLSIVIGTSYSWVMETLQTLRKKNIHAIVVSCQPEELFDNTSYVIIDHARAMNDIVSMLNSAGRGKIALYGINSDSHSDRIKVRVFKDAGYSNSSIYIINNDSLTSCYNNLKENITDYNAIICANDIAAIALINHMISDGFRIPDDYYIISFGNSLIGQVCKVPLTTVSLDHEQLGIQSVLLYLYLYKNPGNVAITVKVPCSLSIRKSAGLSPAQRESVFVSSGENTFYKDKELSEIMCLEKTLQMCDEIDLRIISGILSHQSYSNIAAKTYVSESVVKYRIKRLLNISGYSKSDQLREIFYKYISVSLN